MSLATIPSKVSRALSMSLLIIVALFLVHGLSGLVPAGALIDFEVYVRGGLRLGEGHDLYAPHAGELPFTYPPFAALIFRVFTWVSLPEAKVYWTLLNMAMLLRLAYILTSRSSWIGPRGSRMRWRAGLIAAICLSEPIVSNFGFGQINILLVYLVVEAVNRGSVALGVAAGFAAAVKLTPLLLVAFLLASRRTRTAGLVAIGFFGLILVSGFVLFPTESETFWLHAIRDPERVGGVEYLSNQSLLGVATRWTKGAEFASLAPVCAAVLVFISALMLKRVGARLEVEDVVALAGASMLLLSPISWTHHWVWGVPLLCRLLCGFPQRWTRIREVVAWVGLVSWCSYFLAWALRRDNDVEFAYSFAQNVAGSLYCIWTILGVVALGGAHLMASDPDGTRRGRGAVVGAPLSVKVK